MWNCPKCGEQIEDHLDMCLKCAPKRNASVEKATKRVGYQIFRGTLTTWDALFTEAAEFASQLAPGQLINISHTEDHNNGVVTVWFWAEEL